MHIQDPQGGAYGADQSAPMIASGKCATTAEKLMHKEYI